MMDSNSPFLPHCNSDTKNAFRKPSGDAANRNYQHRSPVDRSPSPDGWDLLTSCSCFFLKLQWYCDEAICNQYW